MRGTSSSPASYAGNDDIDASGRFAGVGCSAVGIGDDDGDFINAGISPSLSTTNSRDIEEPELSSRSRLSSSGAVRDTISVIPVIPV